MSIAETISAAGSKIRKAIAIPAPTAADLDKRIRGLRGALAIDMEKYTKAAVEEAQLSVLSPEGQEAKERRDQADARVAEHERDIKGLTMAWEAALRREAEELAASTDIARKARVTSYDRLGRDLLASAAEYTAALTTGGPVGAVPAFRNILATATKIMMAFSEVADSEVEFHVGWLSNICLFELCRLGGVPTDLQARHAQYPDLHTVLSFPGTERFLAQHEHADAPERIETLAAAIADKLAYGRLKVVASQDVLTDELAPAPQPAAVKRWPARSPSKLEMYDAPEPKSEVQRTDYAVDGITRVGRPNLAALKAEADDILRGMARDPAALAALRSGETGAVDFGSRELNPRPEPSAAPPLHDTVDDRGEWIDRDGQTMPAPSAKEAQRAPVDPPHQPGIEPFPAGEVRIG